MRIRPRKRKINGKVYRDFVVDLGDLRALFAWAVSEGYLAQSPLDPPPGATGRRRTVIALAKMVQKEPEIFVPEQIARLFTTACSKRELGVDPATGERVQMRVYRRLPGYLALATFAGNAIVTVPPFIGFSLSGMLSPDGRCKAFDATANGFVRAEGCGVVLLKSLPAALADGNPIYAVIRGTAANQGGRTNGITLRSVAAQEAVVREACPGAGAICRGARHGDARRRSHRGPGARPGALRGIAAWPRRKIHRFSF